MGKHQCRWCPRSFARLEHLTRHERSHTKEKPYGCQLCPLAFTRKDLLTRHDRLYHQPPREPSLPTSATGGPTANLPPQPLKTAFPTVPLQIQSPPGGPPPMNDYVSQPSVELFAPDGQVVAGDQGSQGPGENSSLSTMTAATHDFGSFSLPNLIAEPAGDLSVDLFDDYDWSTMFQDESFADLGPASLTDVIHSFHYPQLPPAFPNQLTPAPSLVPARNDLSTAPRQQRVAERVADLSAFATSRLPSLEPEEQSETIRLKDDQSAPDTPSWTAHQNPQRCLLEVTHECRRRLSINMADFGNVIPDDFMLPSKHALNRFVTVFISSFYEHNPLLHLPTTSLDAMSVELFLAIAAIGAHYCGETDTSTALYQVAKDTAFERLRRTESATTESTVGPWESEKLTNGRVDDSAAKGLISQAQIETMQAVVMLFGFTIWLPKGPRSNTRSLTMLRSTIESMIRDGALQAAKMQAERHNDDWHAWARAETVKRIILVAFAVLNLQTLMHETPPPLLWTEIDMALPCSEGRWHATSAAAWAASAAQQQEELREGNLQDTLRRMFHPDRSLSDDGRLPIFSSLGGFFLIHAILQHLWILQKTRRLESPAPYSVEESDDFQQFQRALRQWRRGWANNRESSMSPVNPCGPLAFTSTALLRLAYVRISWSARLIPLLFTWKAESIAKAFIQSPRVERNDRTTRAALHCAHALSIPVKIGVKFVARTQGFYWSNQHAVSSLECALFLCKWLKSVTADGLDVASAPLTQQEMLVLDFVISIVAETDLRAPKEVLLQTPLLLSRTVVQIWARLFPGDSAWDIVDLIGSSLRACADALSVQT